VRLILGTAGVGDRTPASAFACVVERAVERGFRWFDTADLYAAGRAEEILGACVARRRDDVRIATKIGYGDVGGSGVGPRLVTALDASLRRLGVDAVDLVQVHEWGAGWDAGEVLDALAGMVDAGKAHAIGASRLSAEELAAFAAGARERGLDPGPVQMPANVLAPLDPAWRGAATAAGVDVWAVSVLAGGFLAERGPSRPEPPAGSRFAANATYRRLYWRPEQFARREALGAIADELGMSLAHLALAWFVATGGAEGLVVGADSPEQLDGILEGLERRLPADAVTRIEAVVRDR